MDWNEVEKYVEGVAYPASKSDVVDYAKSQNANQEIVSMLGRLPDNNYESPADVTDALEDMGEMG